MITKTNGIKISMFWLLLCLLRDSWSLVAYVILTYFSKAYTYRIAGKLNVHHGWSSDIVYTMYISNWMPHLSFFIAYKLCYMFGFQIAASVLHVIRICAAALVYIKQSLFIEDLRLNCLSILQTRSCILYSITDAHEHIWRIFFYYVSSCCIA